MGLQQFERRLERLVEGVFARAFRSGLQPVEIGRRMTRVMDLERTLAPKGTLTPNHFVVTLSPDDADRFAPIEDELVAELVSVAKDHAAREGYVFIGPVEVDLEVDENLVEGTLDVVGEMVRGTRSRSVADRREAGAYAGGAGGGGHFAPASPRSPTAGVVLPDGRLVPVDVTPFSIGRLPECDLVLADGNVSRRHAEIRASSDGWVLIDLGSTNGTRVNGYPISAPHVLSPGDQISVGNNVLRFDVS
jgi:hypothetical protein